jgi:hypothetical protein
VGNLFKKLQYDTIYHEHHYYYSLESIQNLLAKYNLYIFDVEKIKIHGGSFRIYVRKSNKSVRKSKRLLKEIKKELEMNLYSSKSLKKLNLDVKKTKINAIKYLKKLKSNNVKISAYGAAAKGNTFLNYCKMNNEIIDYVYDNNKLKQNKFLPGSRIKILDPKMIKKNKPDYIIILPWNIKEEIIKTYNFVKTWGCKFLVLLKKKKKY